MEVVEEIDSPPPTADKISDAIKQASELLLGYPLKPKQLEAVFTFMSGKDTFVCLPTGYGKSAIYAILPIAFDFLLGMLRSNGMFLHNLMLFCRDTW